MKKLWAILLLALTGTFAVSASDFTLTIKGTTKRNRINVVKKENLNFRKDSNKQTTVLQFHAGRDFTDGKATLKVKKADEFSFSVAGEFTRDTDTKKNYYHWVEIEKLKINNVVLIGKGSKANPEPLNVSKAKPLADKVKVRSSSDLVIEIKFRETPRSDAAELSEKEGTSAYRKSLREKRERQAKKREERKAKKSGAKADADAEDGADAPKAADSKKAGSKAGSKKAAAEDEDFGGEE